MPLRLTAGLIAAALLSPGARPQDPPVGQGAGGAPRVGYESIVVGAADSDGDGAVSTAEWGAFTRDLAVGGRIDSPRLKARVVAALIDPDRDGRTTMEELTVGLAALDADGDGVIRPQERAGSDGTRGAGGRGQGFRSRLGWGVVTEAADRDGDGAISEQERIDLIDDAGSSGEDTPSPEALRGWVLRVEVRAPSAASAGTPAAGDRAALTPQAFLRAIEGDLDADGDGTRSASDLAKMFAALDADGDGSVSARERFGSQRGSGGASDGSGLEGARPGEAGGSSRPPLIAWQRSLEDALALSRSSGKPLLICVNMDGEPASESFAAQRYRDPAFAELTEGFVPLIVSPDRHTPIDHDDRGRRISDPRFARVVESEHIDIEPLLFERYFQGNRVAPRHLGVASDGTILFDLFLLQDLSQVDDALRSHGGPARVSEAEEDPAPADDLDPLPEEGSSGSSSSGSPAHSPSVALDDPDAQARERVEAAYLAGDWRQRFALSSLALAPGAAVQHPEVLRLALRDEDARVRRQALWAVVREPGKLPADLLGEVMRVGVEEPPLRGALVGALGRLARSSADEAQAARAERAYEIFSGLGLHSASIDVARWKAELAGKQVFTDDATSSEDLEALLATASELEREVSAAPGEAGLRLEQALVLLRLARALLASGQDPSIALEEAGVAASAAEAAGSRDPRAAAVRCASSWLANDPLEAAAQGEHALSGLVPLASTPLARETLRILAKARARAIYEAMRDLQPIESAWVADVRDAHEVLLAHPGGSEQEAAEYLAFLGALDARAEQGEVARRAVARFPNSGDLHGWLRLAVLRDQGADALEAVYAALPLAPAGEAEHLWFTGLATLMAAERQVGNRASEAALAAYARAVASFRASIQVRGEYADSASHYVCLALCGSSRLLAEAQRFEQAVAALSEGFAARPASASAKDGLGHSPAETAAVVLRLLAAAQRPEEARRLREALSAAGVEPAAAVQSE